MYHLARRIGHRGVAGLAAENTLKSIALAAECGFTWVEIDVRITRDGVAVLSHDDSLRRCFGDTRRLSRLSATAAADLGVPSLVEVMELLKHLSLGAVVEIKTNTRQEKATAEAVLEVINGSEHRCMIASFSTEVLTAIRSHLPMIPLAWNLSYPDEDWRYWQKTLNLANLHVWYKHLTAAAIREMKQAENGVYCFTVNDVKKQAALFAQGIDGVFCDFPPSH